MAHRSQSSSFGENPLDPNYLPPHYREEYRMAIDALVEDGADAYSGLLQKVGVVEFLAQPEIEHIKSMVHTPNCSSQPELPYQETDVDGSSDTYWPVHSDLEAPGLDLGWPNLPHSFIGPTEVTTLVNPSDPDTPSIKEHARRLIKNAQNVIALVMDMFTDVDIFADLLNATARHVPVYILLDDQNAHHFAAMVNACKVNLAMNNYMRVRTVAGTTYFCRTGKSFKGQVMDRFLLADCRAVLSGNYSFMWSFEKIHRCIAHLFLGELVTTFDEEFRILFAQSEPLVMENALVPLGSRDTNSFNSLQFGQKRSQSFRHSQGSLRDLSGHTFGDWMDTDRNLHPFRRDESYRHSAIEPGHMPFSNNKYLPQQFRNERPYLDQSWLASRQLQDNAYKRHSYAEGTLESYSSSRQYMKHRVLNNLDEMDSHGSHLQKEQHLYQGGGGSASGQGRYNKIKSQGYHQADQHSDSGYLHEGDPHGSYRHAVDYLSSGSSKEIKLSGSGQAQGDGGRYNPTNPKRPSVGHPYACQTSPTQLHPPDNKRPSGTDDSERQQQDPSVKEGLRSWRINSFLSNIEDAGEEGLLQPLGPDAFDEPPQSSEGKSYGPESSMPRFSARDHTKVPTKPELLPRFGKPILPRAPKETTAAGSSSATEGGKLEDAEMSDSRENALSKHESFRSRVNPMLLRSSRLRSSLIFSSSKLEEHSSVLMKPGHNDEEENDHSKPTSIVAQILEKRRSLSREPFDWRKQKMMDIKDTSHAEVPESEEPVKDTESRKVNPTEHAIEAKPKVAEPLDPPKPATSTTRPTSPTSPTKKLCDPESRLSHFNEQLAKQKASRMAIESSRSPERAAKKPDLADTPPNKINEKPTISITPAEPASNEPAVPPTSSVPAARTPLVTVKPEPVEKTPAENDTKPVADATKKEPKSLKPFPSPKVFKKEILKPFKSAHSRHVSCGEELLTDATDAEKCELKKSRSHSSSSMARIEVGEKQLKKHGSSNSLNLADGGGDGKALEFLKKQTQRLKGFLGTKGDKKTGGAAAADEKPGTQMSTVPEGLEDPPPKAQGGTQGSSRYQSSTSNVLYSSNLRDDTKVILGQISANSQKNRIEMAKQAEESKQGGDTDRKVTIKEAEPSIAYHGRTWFHRAPPSNTQERDTLLRRIESLRKEKKVYSRFEMGNNLG